MKTINTFFVIIALFLLTAVNGYAQVYNMHVGDTLSLDLPIYRGKLQWQESLDSVTWTDIAGATYQPYIVKFIRPYYYRGKVSENSCNPIYTGVIKTILAVAKGIADIDGNTYDTIRIGTQVWFKQTLKTSKLNDGTPIPNVKDTAIWNHLTTNARCYYNNDSLANSGTYGALYNWFTVSTTKLCPTGYHVPTDAEWTTLTTFLGGESSAGSKLKEVGTAHWNAPNSDATNETNFTALPGGGRNVIGAFVSLGLYNYWWSSTEIDATYAWARYMNFSNGNVGRDSYFKISGYAVRCVSDCAQPTTSQAGHDQLNIVGTTATLNANTPTIGTASWQIATGSGTGGSFADITKPNTIFTGVAGNTYKLIWVILNSCSKSKDTVEISFKDATDGIADIDGNTYDTIRIGTQIWFKQNLKATKYNDGAVIPNVTDSATWVNDTIGARCYYNNDSLTYADTYGVLYNWYTVNTTKLCPTGYHVPTDAEWTTLTTFLGGELVAGGKLKEVGTVHWYAPNDATNETNFTALPGGIRVSSSEFKYVDYFGYWWVSTDGGITYTWYRNLGNSIGFVNRSSLNKRHGFSVRCLRD